MHACTRSAKQKYGSIYIFLDENVFENGCIYIYIYIYIYMHSFFLTMQLSKYFLGGNVSDVAMVAPRFE